MAFGIGIGKRSVHSKLCPQINNVNDKGMIAIVILNWNGWQDTIECIKSIYRSENVEFSVVVVDNGSADDSVSRITVCIKEMETRSFFVKEGESLTEPIHHGDIILYELSENYGFAKGNNIGIQLLSRQNIDYYWILNNDTVVETDALAVLQKFMDDNKEYAACTPQIRFFSPNNRIWNCGGKLFFGFRKYYYEGADDVTFNKDCFDISFVTGCALLVRPELLNEQNELFSDKFFFGEEDFEFSLRMKKRKKKMACCTRSIIFHKVSASIKKKPKLSGIYIHYLNRYINVRKHFPPAKYFVWKFINNMNLRRVLAKNGYNTQTVNQFVAELNRESNMYDGVTKEMFETKRLIITE